MYQLAGVLSASTAIEHPHLSCSNNSWNGFWNSNFQQLLCWATSFLPTPNRFVVVVVVAGFVVVVVVVVVVGVKWSSTWTNFHQQKFHVVQVLGHRRLPRTRLECHWMDLGAGMNDMMTRVSWRMAVVSMFGWFFHKLFLMWTYCRDIPHLDYLLKKIFLSGIETSLESATLFLSSFHRSVGLWFAMWCSFLSGGFVEEV